MTSVNSSPTSSEDPFQTTKGLSNLNPNSSVPQTKICVFCGASPGKSPAHLEAARSLAALMHRNNIALVFGGGTLGIMGEIARTLVSLSGPESVHGIIPEPLVKFERADIPTSARSSHFEMSADGKMLPEYKIYGKTTVVKDMHTRKQMMAQEVIAGGPGSGFVALPGGYGTLEELMEVVTWNQLGIHNRGVAIFNVEGYWDGLMDWVRTGVEAGFVAEGNKDIIIEAKDAEGCVKGLAEYKVSNGQFKLTWGNE